MDKILEINQSLNQSINDQLLIQSIILTIDQSTKPSKSQSDN